MQNTRSLLATLFLGAYLLAQAPAYGQDQNYWHYHARTYQATLHCLQEEFGQALAIYDSVFQAFPYVFAKDYMIAAQLALLQNDTTLCLRYLHKAVASGYKTSAFQKWIVFRGVPLDSLKSQEPELMAAYRQSVNQPLNKRLSQNYRRDQEGKSGREAPAIFKENFDFIARLVDSVGFPGVRMVGIDDQRFDPIAPNSDMLAQLKDKEAANAKVIVALLHYDHSVSQLGYETLMKAIEDGQLLPSEFTEMYSFEVYANQHKVPAGLPVFNFGRWNAKAAKSEDCARFFVLTPAQQQQRTEVETKYRIKLSFGY